MKRNEMIITYFRLSERERQERFADANTLRILKGKTFAVGKAHFAVLNQNGTVTADGDDSDGQCAVSGWKNVTKIVAGDYHTAALRRNGTVVAAGSNTRGQCDVGGWRDVVELYAEGEMTVGVTAGGELLVTGKQRRPQEPKKLRYADVAGLPPTPESSFYYSIENNSVRIWDYVGREKRVVIPMQIQGKPVRVIDQRAFENGKFEEVVLPLTITGVGEGAFRSCRSLKKIYLSAETNARLYGALRLAVDYPEVITT